MFTLEKFSLDTVTEVFRNKRWVLRYETIPLVIGEGADDDELEAGAQQTTTKSFAWADSPTINKILTTILSVLGQILNVLRPAILTRSKEKKRLHNTDWLNGVRGLAAFFVAIYHIVGVYYPGANVGWSSENPHFLQLPIIRVFYHGQAMVTLFFIVSGYALSYKALSLIGKKEQLLTIFQSLASSTFRRAFRLFIPCGVVALFKVWFDHFNLWYPPIPQDPQFNTVPGLLWFWFDAMITSINPFSSNIPYGLKLMKIDLVFWTIPVEYRGSLAVFVLLLVLSKTRPWVCLGSLVVFLLWLTYVGQSDIFLFVSGMICCQIKNLTSGRTRAPTLTPTPTPALEDASSTNDKPKTSWRHVVLSVACFSVALMPILYVLTQPAGWLQPPDWAGWGDAPFYPTLNAWIPRSWQGHDEYGRFWRCIAAISFILLADHNAIFRRFFELSFPQYLGKISFSLYLVHASQERIIATRLKHLTSGWTNSIGNFWLKEFVSLTIVAIIFLPILFWISEIATKCLDQASVDLAKWLEAKVYAEQKPTTTGTENNTHSQPEPVDQQRS